MLMVTRSLKLVVNRKGVLSSRKVSGVLMRELVLVDVVINLVISKKYNLISKLVFYKDDTRIADEATKTMQCIVLF